MDTVYGVKHSFVVEWTSEGADWQEKEFADSEDAEAEILSLVGFGYAVRMYIRES